MSIHEPYHDLLSLTIEIRGRRWYLEKLAEECCELGAAILQHLNKDAPFSRVLEEAADVSIHLEALSHFDTGGAIEHAIIQKYKRIENKLAEPIHRT